MNTELKQNIETLAGQEGKTQLEIIGLLQAGAAQIGDEATLDALCDLKWQLIEAA